MVVYTFGTPLVPREHPEQPRGRASSAWLFHTLVVLQPTGLLFREASVGPRVAAPQRSRGSGRTQEELGGGGDRHGSMALARHAADQPERTTVEDYVLPRRKASDWWLPVQTTFWACEALAIYVFYRDSSQEFLYFQF
jgi:hypothetical protein